jgi:hypothetical protein
MIPNKLYWYEQVGVREHFKRTPYISWVKKKMLSGEDVPFNQAIARFF